MPNETPLVAIKICGSNWFGQGDAFWLWVRTLAAAPTCRLRLLGGNGKPDLLAPQHPAQLADSIKAQHGPLQGCTEAG